MLPYLPQRLVCGQLVQRGGEPGTQIRQLHREDTDTGSRRLSTPQAWVTPHSPSYITSLYNPMAPVR